MAPNAIDTGYCDHKNICYVSIINYVITITLNAIIIM